MRIPRYSRRLFLLNLPVAVALDGCVRSPGSPVADACSPIFPARAAQRGLVPWRVQPRTLSTRDPDGFYLCGIATLRESGFGAEVAEEPGSLCRLARRIGWSNPPRVDFSRYIVFAFARPLNACTELQEPLQLDLDANAVLIPELAVATECGSPLIATDVRGLVRCLAVARTALPEAGFRFQTRTRLLEFSLRHPLGRLPVDPPPCELPSTSIFGAEGATLPVPSSRDAELARLNDGAFVWVVRHEDDTVSVFDGRFPASGYTGLSKLAYWEPQTHRFERELWDEYGVSRWHPNLTRYATRVDLEHGRVSVGEPIGSLRRKLMNPIKLGKLDAEAMWRRRQRFLDGFPWLNLDRALLEPDDTWVLIDAHLVFDPKRAPRVWSNANAFGTPNSERDFARPVIPSQLENLRTPQQYGVIGPLIARVRGGRFYDITLTREPAPLFDLPIKS